VQYRSGVPFYIGKNPYALGNKNKIRKLVLESLLVRPVFSMRGIAYNNKKWWDFDSVRDFHSSCNDFLKIVMLTEAQQSAKIIKDFITSNLLVPTFVPPNLDYNTRRLNHFKIFWNVMHQLPFYVKKFDEPTKAKLRWFYEVGVSRTLPCKICQVHYRKWLLVRPVTADCLENLNLWVFQLHDHVNWVSKKPPFPWSLYKRRWAPRNKMCVQSYNGLDTVLNIKADEPSHPTKD